MKRKTNKIKIKIPKYFKNGKKHNFKQKISSSKENFTQNSNNNKNSIYQLN